MNEDNEGVNRGVTAAGGTDGGRTVRLLPGPAEEYLAGIRSVLADLPAPELAEILDDVRAHLADLTAELGADASHAALVARLGSPAVYAGELRVAAGYPPAPVQAAGPGRSRSTAATFAVAGLVGSVLLVALGAARAPAVVLLGLLVPLIGLPLLTRDGPGLPTVAALPLVRRLADSRPAAGTPARGVADFLASLQPAWWVVRGVFGAAVLHVPLRAGPALIVLLALVTVPVSVWLGHRTRRDRRLLWAVVPLNTLAAVLALSALFSGGAGLLGGPQPARNYPSQSYQQPGLWQDMDRQIHDIRPVDAAGNPLTGVYLFDQDGRPIDTSDRSPCEVDSRTGEPAANAARPYPRGRTDYDPRTGDCVVVPPGPLLVAVPSATPQASATTTASPPPTTPAATTPAATATGSPTTGAAPPSVAIPPAPPAPPAPPSG